MTRAQAYLPTKWHLDPSNRLATIQQRHRQDRTDRTTVRWHRANRFTNGRPKSTLFGYAAVGLDAISMVCIPIIRIIRVFYILRKISTYSILFYFSVRVSILRTTRSHSVSRSHDSTGCCFSSKQYHSVTQLRFYVSMDTKQVISETFFLANLLA